MAETPTATGTPSDERRFWAFISFSHDDESFARTFHERLESYEIPRRFRGKPTPAGRDAPDRFHPVLLDEKELVGSSDLGEEIENALERSDFLIVLCSPRSAASRWVNEEVRLFKAMGRARRIISVVLDGEPRASLVSPSDTVAQHRAPSRSEAFPPALLYRVVDGVVTGQEAPEPLWLDHRPTRDPHDVLLKVVAGMLGADLGELQRRDRRRRQLRWATRAGLTVAATAAAIAGTAFASRLINYERAITIAYDQLAVEPLLSVDRALYALDLRDQERAVEALRQALENASELVQLRHPEPVSAVSIDSTASHVAAATPVGVFVWNLSDGAGARFAGADRATAVAISPGGERLVGAETDRLVVWDLTSGQDLASLPTDGPAGVLSFDRSGDRVAAGFADGSALVWPWRGGADAEVYAPHGDSITSITFGPDGTSVVTGSLDLTAAVWDAATGVVVRREALEARALSVDLASDGTTLLTVEDGRRPRVWSPPLRPWAIPADGTTSARLGPLGTLAATAGGDGPVRVYNVPARDSIPLLSLYGHRGGVRDVRFANAFPPRIVTAGADSTVRIWDPGLGSRLLAARHSGGIRRIRVNADGTRAFTGGLDRQAFLWDLRTASAIAQVGSRTATVAEGEFDRSGTRLATAGLDGLIRVHDAGTGRLLHVSPGLPSRPFTVAFSPDSRSVVAGAEDGSLYVWTPGLEVVDTRLAAHSGAIRVLARSPSGAWMAAASDDGTASLWTSSGELVHRLEHDGPVSGISFSPDDSWILTTSDSIARIWSTRTGLIAAELSHPHVVLHAQFGAESSRLATVSADGNVRMWTETAGVWQSTVLGADADGASPDSVPGSSARSPQYVTFSHDGSMLAVAGLGSEVLQGPAASHEPGRRPPLVELWTTQGQLQSELPGHRGGGQAVTAAVFTRDDARLLTAAMDGIVWVHPVGVGDLQELARSVLAGHRMLEAR